MGAHFSTGRATSLTRTSDIGIPASRPSRAASIDKRLCSMCFPARARRMRRQAWNGSVTILRFSGRAASEVRPIMAENSKRKLIVTVALIVVLAIAIVSVLALRRQAPQVTVVHVAREDLSATISSNGKVEPISPDVAHAEFPTFVDKVM